MARARVRVRVVSSVPSNHFFVLGLYIFIFFLNYFMRLVFL